MAVKKTDVWTNKYRVRAHFRLMGKELDPDEVTQLLRLEPHTAHRRGDPRPGPRCTDFWEEGLWSISSTPAVAPDQPLRDHLSWLLNHLEPIKREVRRLIEGGNRADLYIGFTLLTGHGGPELEPDILGRLAGLGVPVGFEIHAKPA